LSDWRAAATGRGLRAVAPAGTAALAPGGAAAAGHGAAVDERALLAGLLAGDESAFELFAAHYLPGLLRYARRRLSGDPELARDLAQAAACKAIEKLAGFRGEAPLFSWLCAICGNEIAAHFRRTGRRPAEVPLGADDGSGAPGGGTAVAAVASAAGPEERLLRLETAELVHAALDHLPASYARAVEWRYLEGVEVNEIARRLQASYKAAESLLSRARRAFREAYENLAGGAEAASRRQGAATRIAGGER
jgi:RNA polymerase sigma-70 factor (ECF subfamily)